MNFVDKRLASMNQKEPTTSAEGKLKNVLVVAVTACAKSVKSIFFNSVRKEAV